MTLAASAGSRKATPNAEYSDRLKGAPVTIDAKIATTRDRDGEEILPANETELAHRAGLRPRRARQQSRPTVATARQTTNIAPPNSRRGKDGPLMRPFAERESRNGCVVGTTR